MERFDLVGMPYATQAAAIAGLIDNKLMTPLKTKQSIQENAPVKTVNGKTGDIIIDSLPPGTIIAYAGDSVPDGFVAGNGAAVSRTTYARIFNIFGTKYGAGDGKTTFNLPNLNNGSFLEGSNTAGTVKSAGLPNITGSISKKSGAGTTTDFLSDSTGLDEDGALSVIYGDQNATANDSAIKDRPNGIIFDASKSNAIYGASDTVQPKSVTVKYCIKY